ncbi:MULTISPECIES: flagellar hook-associated protein FlgL [unclassified Anoxybacillus]|uniref:flagellar hook-associated protein FlgL n=1 Tax=unclassified Anoxybacillus TaxID=2639704 RepID=UPI001EDC1567|nr:MULTISPECIES: flagellar hook-associated protein FlgL [unclassified Anoxybacillus]MCG3085225.1 flagellar hook-associated protein FlgL [Anoxybacillus sp. LAT27]MCG5025029.1 flagellar hook-associated protein FlgL [Anoxybacillus flavithermus]MCG6176146.1 flagellar hook-associated protein FlgL [Anoxybacillus sp. LAT_31]MCG6179990.1 flagellar hook-associated protein FlgL [Anoxybacillus sp. LAT_33]
MRVTQMMLANNTLRNVSKSYDKLGTYQQQLATGKKIHRPSEDPVVAMKGMHYRTSLTEIEQFQRNLSEAYTWMENSESALNHTTNVLQRARELVVQAKNGTLGQEDRQAIAREIEQLKKDLVQVANTKVAGKYVFNGTNIEQAPVADGTPPTVTNNNDDFMVEVAKGVKLKINVTPNNVFNQGLFDTLQQIENELANPTNNLDNLLSQLDTHINDVLAERAELGARVNRLELVEQRLSEQQLIAKRMISDNEDADIEKIITELKSQESVHRAALSVGARIIQPTLVDFLR